MTCKEMCGKTFKVTSVSIAAVTLDNGSRWYNYPNLKVGDTVKVIENRGLGEPLYVLQKVS